MRRYHANKIRSAHSVIEKIGINLGEIGPKYTESSRAELAIERRRDFGNPSQRWSYRREDHVAGPYQFPCPARCARSLHL